jgi:uncharacterized membrane protein
VILIGLVLLVLVALAAVAAVHTGQNVRVHLDGYGVHTTTSVLWVFCAGAVAMLLLVLALAAFARAARRRRLRRRELKAQRAEEAAAEESRAADARAAQDRAPEPHQTEAAAVAPTPVDRAQPVDVREGEPGPAAHAYQAEDPGPERRYVPGDERQG